MVEIINERLNKCKHSFNIDLLKCRIVKNSHSQQTFSDRLKAAMAQAGIQRPTDLARKAGASPQLVNKWLKGTTQNIRAVDLFKLGDALRVSTRWLLYGNVGISQYKQLTIEECELLAIFNAMPEDWREDWVKSGRNTLTRLSIKPSVADPFPSVPPPIQRKN